MSLKIRIIGIVVICILMLAMVSPTKVSAAEENVLPFEHIIISLDCDKALLSVAIGISCNDTNLIHFPSGVDLFAPELDSCTRLYTVFGKESSMLSFEFNNTSPSEAKANADAVKPSFETAFNTTFTWQYTNTSSTYVYVLYYDIRNNNHNIIDLNIHY